MKILLFGKNGQVGWELQRSLSLVGNVITIGRNQTGGNLAEPFACSKLIKLEKPDVVINAAAYTEVDRAESEPELCRRVNAIAVDEIAAACAEIGSLLVHYSTDYVFDGSGNRPWKEDDPPNPLNVYGRTKLESELAIRNSGCHHLIFRTSWVYSVRGANFAKKILKLAKQHDTLSVISDQFGAPTGAELIADVTAQAIRCCRARSGLSGTYHLAPKGETTWHNYASYCIESVRSNSSAIRLKANKIIPISTVEYETAALRPLNSRICAEKIQNTFDLNIPNWQYGIDRLIENLTLETF